jgi:hypothetical protein
MLTTTSKFFSTPTNRKIVAVCSWRTYDVLGNARDGFEVNDSFSQGEIRIPAVEFVHNLPAEMQTEESFNHQYDNWKQNVFLSIVLEDKAIKKAVGASCRIDVSGDDRIYYINRESNGKPLCEIHIERFELAD